jgi:single-strand DNA-binding protein
MSNSTICIVGNVVDEVVNKPTLSGLSKVSFRVASTQRRFDREAGQWVDGHKLFVKVGALWRQATDSAFGWNRTTPT